MQLLQVLLDISLCGYKYDKSDLENDRKFDDYINRRNESQELFEKAFRTAQPNYQMKTDEMMIAEDIWQVIRHKLWKDRHGDEDSWCVDSRNPMCMTGEPLPKMERMEG